MRTGTLREAGPGIFRLGDVGTWARAKWSGGEFSDMPIFPGSGSASLALSGRYGLKGAGYTHATTLEAATEEVLTLRAENRALAQALVAAEAQVRELEPDARNFRSWIDKKRKPSG